MPGCAAVASGVGDVAAAFANALEDRTTFGKHYELCGPRTYALGNWCALSPGTAANAKSSCACRTGHRACRPSILQYAPASRSRRQLPVTAHTQRVQEKTQPGRARVTATSLENAGTRFLTHMDKNLRRNQLRRHSQR